MHARIEYCVVWNYEPRAAGLAAELRQAFPDIAIEMVESSGGAFEVTVDGMPVYSKKALGRHARPGEVVELVRSRG